MNHESRVLRFSWTDYIKIYRKENNEQDVEVDGEELILMNLPWASFCRFLLRARAIQQFNIPNSNRGTNAATSSVMHCNGILQLLNLQMQYEII
jgi:hypothetical protein